MSMKSKAEEAERRADELYAQHFGRKQDEGATEDPKPPESTTEGDKPTEPVLSQDEPKVEEPVAAAVVPDPDLAPPPEPKKEKEVDWEHKYKVLMGKYNKEVKSATENNQRLMDMITSMDSQIKDLHQSLSILTSKEADDKKAERIQSIEQLKQEYPAIYAGVVAQVEETLSASVKPQIDEVKGKIEAKEKSDAASAQEVFFSVLSGIVEDWSEINNDPEFHTWLQGREKYARENRFKQMEAAYHAGDAKAVAEFMVDFKSHMNAERDRKATEQAAAQKKVEQKVVPETSKTPAPKLDKAADGPKTYTTAFITGFYRDFGRRAAVSSYYKNLAEAEKISLDIDQAAREGRVVRSGHVAP